MFLDKQYHKTYAHSWRPIGQIALDMEQARMKQLQALLKGTTLHSMHVDCVVFSRSRGSKLPEQIIEKVRYASGEPVFKLESKPFLPKWPLEPQPACEAFQQVEWRLEGEREDVLDLTLEHGGAMICGPPGTGKTWLMQRLAKGLRF